MSTKFNLDIDADCQITVFRSVFDVIGITLKFQCPGQLSEMRKNVRIHTCDGVAVHAAEPIPFGSVFD